MSGKRSIFEDVSGDQPKEATLPETGLIDRASGGARGAIRVWLVVLFALVTAMILVGGLTRLTDSGLSITEWKPVTGALPPMSGAAWDAEFAKYQTIPEYQLQNRGMTLSDFKAIYWWEWGHRQLGRVVGLVWALGFLYFVIRKQIPTGWTNRLLAVGVLGGVQGVVGWWMVSSGLTGNQIDVASYRLAVHLGLAFVILGLLAWFILGLSRRGADLMQARRAREANLATWSGAALAIAFFQILLGALVAGIDAGRGFTDWPLMAGQFLPPDAFDLVPGWRNFFENAGLVQFIHRMIGYLLVGFGLLVWHRSRDSGNATTRRAFDWVALMLLGQMVLGIVAVLYSAPWHIAILHQAGAVLLWVLILRALFHARYPTSQTIKRGLK